MTPLATLALLLPISAAAAAAGAPRSGDGATAILAADLRRHVERLAADDMEGRDTGTAGTARAEEYIAAEFRRYGLDPLPGRDDHFAGFTLYRATYDLARTTLEVSLARETHRAVAGSDFRPFPFSDEGAVEGGVVFAGYGIHAPERGHDDYAGLDVEGKLVLVLRHAPHEGDPASPFNNAGSTEHALFSTKAETARTHGARGMLLVTDPLHHAADDDLRLSGRLALERASGSVAGDGAGAPGARAPFLSVHIGRRLAEEIVAGSGRSLTELQRALDEGTPAARLPPLGGAQAKLAVERGKREEEVGARNVVAFLPGRDRHLREEWIVIGAHHDHVGRFDGQGDTVFNGADDNASGTAAVLELAQTFAAAPERPRRSLVFVTFTGEEHGLLGSRALVTGGALPLERVRFMLNLDMIGRNSARAIDVVGDGYARGLRERIEAANLDRLDLAFAGDAYSGNSDHEAFYGADVPFLFFFSGTHEDYHQVGDHADKLDYGRMQRIAALAERVIVSVANADAAPSFVHHVTWLGIRIEIEELAPGPAVARVTGVDEGSRGAAAGLRVGDLITAFEGEPLVEAGRVGQGFREIVPGTGARIGIERGGEPGEVAITRAKPGFLGIVPEALDDDVRRTHGLHDGQGIVVQGVVPDGPGARSGLQPGDVVVAINGRPLGAGDLSAKLAQIGAGESVALELLRDGERRTIEVRLGERPAPP